MQVITTTIYDQLAKEKASVMEDAIFSAYAIMAMLGMKDDDISEREARETYGRKWLDDRTERGLLHFTRIGPNQRSAKMYSRFEISALKRSEKRIENAFYTAQRRAEEYQQFNEK